MISDRDIKALSKIHPRNSRPACMTINDLAIVHSPFFVLELPKQQIKVTEWPAEPYPAIIDWRIRQIPTGEKGQRAQLMRETWEEDDDLPVVRLQADGSALYIQGVLYDFFDDQLPSPEFRLYPGEREDGTPYMVGVYSEEKLVGAVAPVQRDTPDESEPESDE